MSTLTQYDVWQIPATSSGDFGKHLRVRFDANGELALAGSTEDAVGFLTERGAEQGFSAAVRKYNAPTVVAVAAGAIAVGGDVFAAANGQVAGTGTVQLGQAWSVATNAGDLITLVPTR